jgi:hypothetical protein
VGAVYEIKTSFQRNEYGIKSGQNQHGKTIKVELNLVLTGEGSHALGFGILTQSVGGLTHLISLLGIGIDSN